MKNSLFHNILFFDTMLTPKVITFTYWVLLLAALLGGIGTWSFGSSFGTFGMSGSVKFLTGLGILLGGALVARFVCELLIVLFKMNEALQHLRSK